jgi:tellurite resistance protein TehA-like permease
VTYFIAVPFLSWLVTMFVIIAAIVIVVVIGFFDIHTLPTTITTTITTTMLMGAVNFGAVKVESVKDKEEL